MVLKDKERAVWMGAAAEMFHKVLVCPAPPAKLWGNLFIQLLTEDALLLTECAWQIKEIEMCE